MHRTKSLLLPDDLAAGRGLDPEASARIQHERRRHSGVVRPTCTGKPSCGIKRTSDVIERLKLGAVPILNRRRICRACSSRKSRAVHRFRIDTRRNRERISGELPRRGDLKILCVRAHNLTGNSDLRFGRNLDPATPARIDGKCRRHRSIVRPACSRKPSCGIKRTSDVVERLKLGAVPILNHRRICRCCSSRKARDEILNRELSSDTFETGADEVPLARLERLGGVADIKRLALGR